MENGMLLYEFDYNITVWQEPLRFDGCSMRIHPRLLGLIFFTHVATVFFRRVREHA